MINLTLPYPPSVNHYLGRTGNRVYVKKQGKAYVEDVFNRWMFHKAKKDIRLVGARYFVNIQVFPPDKRKRDLDNVLKVLLDSLTKAGVWEDDELIDKLVVERKEVVSGGKIEISIGRLLEGIK